MNARCSPGWILSNHTEDQGANLFADTLPSSYLADSGDPRPIQTKSRSMPVHDGSRSDQDERLPPLGPERFQGNPEQLVQGSQSTARSSRVQSQQLATESKVFEDEVRPATERTEQPAEEMPERHDHGKNFSGKDRIKLAVQSISLSLATSLNLARNSGIIISDVLPGGSAEAAGIRVQDIVTFFMGSQLITCPTSGFK